MTASLVFWTLVSSLRLGKGSGWRRVIWPIVIVGFSAFVQIGDVGWVWIPLGALVYAPASRSYRAAVRNQNAPIPARPGLVDLGP
jgi:hypothetical protein